MEVALLYRIFYILFAMEVAAVVLFPLLLLFRALMQNFPKKYTVWMWRLYFLRIICPIAISSLFCIEARWNRWYHRILEGLGLTMEKESGLLRSWSTVLHGEITTTFSYRVCAWGWLFGVVFLLIVMSFRQGRIKRDIRTREKQLDGRLYQSAVKVPAMTGIIRQRFYLPEKTGAKQARYTVAHMETHRRRKSAFWNLIAFLVTILHWFDPFVWAALRLSKTDEEMACDEETIRRMGMEEQRAYTQSILNMAEEEAPVPYTICVIFETGLAKRAQRALHWRKASIRQRMTGVLLLSLLFFNLFMLRPLQIVWAGGTWQQGQNESVQRTIRETETVTQVSVISPGGLQHTLKLNVEKGTQAGNALQGRFSLVMEDSMGNMVDEVFLQDEFQKQGIELEKMSFSQGIVLHTGDYNNDTVQELIIGQQSDWNDEQRDIVQSVLSTDEETLSDPEDGEKEEKASPEPDSNQKEEKATSEPDSRQKKEKASPEPDSGQKKEKTTSEPDSGQKKEKASSELDSGQKKEKATSEPDSKQKKVKASPDKQDNKKSSSAKEYVYLVFQLDETSIEEVSEPVYGEQMPDMESLTPGTMEDIKDIFYTSTEQGRIYYVWNQAEKRYEAERLEEEQLNQHRLASQGTQESGVEETFTLTDNDGEECMRVETMTDTTGSKAIQKVIMTRGEREMKSVEGYYCDLQWAMQSDASIGNYAILTYNGTKAQTFIVYDIQNREEFYRHEDGNTILNRVFEQYNDSEIHFAAGSAVVYTLLEQKENLLTISFAAQAEGDITVRGVYDYDTEKETISNLQFSQTNEGAGEENRNKSSHPTDTAPPIPTINSNLEQYL